MLRKVLIFFISTLLGLQNCWSNGLYFYKVKNGENATKILYIAHLKPIYAFTGTLAALQQVNQSNIADINQLKTNEKIFFNEELVQIGLKKGTLRIENNNEILITESAYLAYEQYKNRSEIRIPASEDVAKPEVSQPTNTMTSKKTDITAASDKLLSSPTAEPPSQQDNTVLDSKVLHSVSTGFKFNYSTLTSKDAQNNKEATLVTDQDLELSVAFGQLWTSKFKSIELFNYRNLNFEQSKGSSKTLSETTKNLAGFSFGFQYQFNSVFGFESLYEFKQQLFTRGVTTSTVTIDKAFISDLNFKFKINLFEKDDTTVRLDLSGQSYFGSKLDAVDINSGYGLGAELSISKKYKGAIYEIGFGHHNRSQDTSVTSQTESLPNAFIGYSANLFGP